MAFPGCLYRQQSWPWECQRSSQAEIRKAKKKERERHKEHWQALAVGRREPGRRPQTIAAGERQVCGGAMGAGRGITASAILGTMAVTVPRHREDLRPERQVPGPEQGLGKREGLFRLPNVLQVPDTHLLCPMDRWPS